MASNLGLQGGKELAAQLKALPDKLSITAVRRAGIIASKPILDAAKENAPDPSVEEVYVDKYGTVRTKERTGRMQEHLSRGSRYIKSEQKVNNFIGVIRQHKAKMKRQGTTGDAYYSRYVEKGTRFQEGQHFLIRAMRDNAQEFLDLFTPALAEQIKKAASKR